MRFQRAPDHHHHHDNHYHHDGESSSQIISTGHHDANHHENGPPDVPSSSILITEQIASPSSSQPPYKMKSRLKDTIKSNIRKITSKMSPKSYPISTSTIPTISQSQEINTNSHPVIQVFREEQLGRNLLVLAIPIATGFTVYHNPRSLPLAARLAVLALSLGSAAIWNGVLLRKVFPKASNAAEFLGVALMLIAFFGYLASLLPKGYLWPLVLCFVACLVPLSITFCGCKVNAPENGGDDPVPAAQYPV